jgi:hypothetical protein
MVPEVETPVQSRIKWQNEFQGYCDLRIPNNRNLVAVMATDFKYSPKITVYYLNSGVTETLKLAKKNYTQNPFAVGSVLSIRTEKRPKWKKNENGDWIQDAALGYDNWIVAYNICYDI